MFTSFQRPQRRLAAGLFTLTSALLVTGLPARADLIVQTNTSSPYLITDFAFENISDGVKILDIVIGNDNAPNLAITMGVVKVDPPVAAGGDTGFDLVTDVGDTGACDNKPLNPSNTPFTVAGSHCTFSLVMHIADADPTDKLKPVDDFGEWYVNVHIPWTRADGATSETLITVDEKVLDDGIPEPATGLLGATGLGLMALGAWRRRAAV
jgi:hypothetical protein